MKDFALWLMLSAALPLAAQPPAAPDPAETERDVPQESMVRDYRLYPRTLSAFEPSYFCIVWDREPEPHPEFYISIQYPIPLGASLGWLADRILDLLPGAWTGRASRMGQKGSDALQRWLYPTLYFAYNGKYEFFTDRFSGPVVSNIQNPGLYVRSVPRQKGEAFFWFVDLGWFHESNGLTITTPAEYAATPHAEDYVSRGWDYLSADLALVAKLPDLTYIGSQQLGFYLRLRHFLETQGLGSRGKEEDVFWEPVARQPARKRYDGLRLVLQYEHAHLRMSDELRTGVEESLGNISNTFELVLRPGYFFPVKFFYFSGYGRSLSTYHIYDTVLGVGLDLL